jgi:hypothetical protein
MQTRWKIIGAAVAAGLVLVVGTGVAVAASGDRGGKGVAVAGERGPLTAVAAYLGLTVDQVRDALRDDKSLAQIAGEQGKSVDGLKQAIRADAEQKLSQAVTNGRITAAQKQEMLERLNEHIDELVNRTGPPMRGECRGPTEGAAVPA